MKLGFIGGGQMATALAKGAIAAQILTDSDLVFVEPSPAASGKLAAAFPNAEFAPDIATLLEKTERVVLAVKPQILKIVAPQLKAHLDSNHCVVSILAGVSLTSLEQQLGSGRIIRVMPNTPCQVSAGASGVAAGSLAQPSDIAWVMELMTSVGLAVQVQDEQLHAVTGVSGSGPAYAYLVIEALSDGGVAMGLSRDVATQLAAQTLLGAAKMVLETDLHPGALKDQVTSPGGTTIAAIGSLEDSGIRSAFMKAVAAATQRSRELGQD